MTPKQEERIRIKIDKIKKALVADKKTWGGQYRDGRGYRYLQPALYLQLKDYKGAQKYFNWFSKNFEEDSGFPIFLFEWTITLFKNKKLMEAEKKALETFMSNTYLFDKFLGKNFLEFEKAESSNWEMKYIIENMNYSSSTEEFSDFTNWLESFVTSEKFYKVANEFIEIQQKLIVLPIGKERSQLIKRDSHLLDNY